MRTLILFAFSLMANIGWRQHSSLTKNQIDKILNADNDHTEWSICNVDSSFFKSDTLRLYNNINYFYQKSNCCKLVTWRFYKKNAFTLSGLEVCKEPPVGVC